MFAGCGTIRNIYIQKQPGPVTEKKKSFFNLEDKIIVCLKLIVYVFHCGMILAILFKLLFSVRYLTH